jgi:hypothetical protein
VFTTFTALKPRKVQYTLALSGWLAATLFLSVKCFLYDVQEYEADLFSILQLTKDYLNGKPFLFENAYGDNSALHNYYLLPFFAPFTLLFGGKGLFVAAYALWIWAWNLWAKLLKSYPLSAGLGFLLIVFGPTAFYQWDNPHFGWHAENFYYPLLLLYAAALLLNFRITALLAAFMIVLNREDGILLAAGPYLVYTWSDRVSFAENLRRSLIISAGTAVVFFSGLLLLRVRSGGQSRLSEAAERFGRNYSPDLLFKYFTHEFWLWFLLAGVLLIPVFLMLKGKERFLPLAGVVLVVTAVNFMAAAYYFPDGKYGINWAPRLSGMYGLLCGFLLMAFYQREKAWGGMSAVGVALFFVQAFAPIGPDYAPYSFTGRFELISRPEKRKLPDAGEREKLRYWFEGVARNEPVRTEEVLFSMTDHADLVWPDTLRIPFREPGIAVLYKSRSVNPEIWAASDSTLHFIKYVKRRR